MRNACEAIRENWPTGRRIREALIGPDLWGDFSQLDRWDGLGVKR